MGHGMTMGGAGMMGAMGIWAVLWALAGLVVLGALVVGTLWLAHRFGVPGPRVAAGVPEPVQILMRRYAAGEIEDDEYERRLYELALH